MSWIKKLSSVTPSQFLLSFMASSIRPNQRMEKRKMLKKSIQVLGVFSKA